MAEKTAVGRQQTVGILMSVVCYLSHDTFNLKTMKIKITIIEIDIPDRSDQPVYHSEPPKSGPPKPFFDLIRREIERVIEPELLLENPFHGPFLAQ